MSPRGIQGDEAELFARYHHRLLNVTARRVTTSRDIVEEACAFAWATLLQADVRRETAYSWLKVVARNEAIRLEKLDRAAISIDEHELAGVLPDETANPSVTPERWNEAMRRLGRLPERERRVVLMRAFGFNYDEIAAELGVKYSLVNRLFTNASRQFLEMEERDQELPERAAQLQDLEHRPPLYLREAIGRLPRDDYRTASASRRREWRRLAIAIENHRAEFDLHDPRLALGQLPRSRDERFARERLLERIDAFAGERRPELQDRI